MSYTVTIHYFHAGQARSRDYRIGTQEHAVETAFGLSDYWGEAIEVRPINDPKRQYCLIAGFDGAGNEVCNVFVRPNSDNDKGLCLLPSWAQPEK